MPLSFGCKVILREIEKREEKKAWDIWIARYPHMIIPSFGSKKPPLEFVTFSKFYKKLKAPIDNTPDEDILKDVEAIRTRKKEGEKLGNI